MGRGTVRPLRSPIGNKVPGMGTHADYDGNNFRLGEGESKDLSYGHCQTACQLNKLGQVPLPFWTSVYFSVKWG